MMKLKFSFLMTIIFGMISGQLHALTVGQFLKSSDAIQQYSEFKEEQCFHCPKEESIVTIDGRKYEISTFRVIGLKDSNKYQNFEALVKNLKIENHTSTVKALYKDFPHVEFELFNVKVNDPNIQILIALRIIKE